ncbi:MAG: PAS domain-containing protein [Streptosporangiaceae bacterium]
MTGAETHADGRRSGPPGPRAAGDGIAGDSRFRAALETMLDSSMLTTAVRDGDGRIVDFVVDYINPVAEIGQRPAEEIVGRRYLDVWPSIAGSPIWGMILHLMETGEPLTLDNFVYSEVIDGQAVTAAFDIRMTRLGDGFLENFRDVTDRYRVQQDLETSEKRFRTAVDALMDPFFIFAPVQDAQGKNVDLEYRYINQAALQLYQMPLQDIIGHRVLELFPSNRKSGSWDTYLEPIETGVPARADLPDFDDHGVKGQFEVSLTPFDGGLIVSARDVSEARQAREALQASEERFRTSVEALNDGFAIFSAVRDSAGAITDFRYEYMNEAGCRMDQRSREDTLGHSLTELFPATVTSGLLAAYARVADTGKPLTRDDIDYEDVYGGRRLARAFDIRIVKLGDGIVATWRDVAERRRAEETMTGQAAELRRIGAELEDRVQERTADLLRSNQELESFGYSVAHDLRTPLRAIDGYCQILLDEHAAQLDPDGQELLGTAGRSAVRMGHLIEGMLALARIGPKDLGHVRIDMTALVESVVTDLRRVHAGAWPAIAVGQLAEASGNAELIRQVWENLITNAVKFSAGRADAQVRVDSQTADGEVIYHVRDNGIGFDMAYAGKLFGVFQRLHPAEFPGTGIGLAIVARIMERHGGRVWAEGLPGDGACFSFSLPAPSTEEKGTP